MKSKYLFFMLLVASIILFMAMTLKAQSVSFEYRQTYSHAQQARHLSTPRRTVLSFSASSSASPQRVCSRIHPLRKAGRVVANAGVRASGVVRAVGKKAKVVLETPQRIVNRWQAKGGPLGGAFRCKKGCE